MNSLGFLESVWQDLRYAARVLRLSPGFFVIATISLALGVGANTAIFQLLDAVRLRILPVPNAQQLVEVKVAENRHCCNGNFSDRRPNLTFAQWEEIRTHQQAFSGIFAWANTEFNLTQRGEVNLAEGLWVSGDFFKTLGVNPVTGRLLEASDNTKSCTAAGAVISFPFWQRHFGGDPAAIGKTLLLNGHPVSVMGVTPVEFLRRRGRPQFRRGVACMCRTQSSMERTLTSITATIGGSPPLAGLNLAGTLARANAQMQNNFSRRFSKVPSRKTTFYPDDAGYYRQYKLTALPAGSGTSGLCRERYETPLLLLFGIAGLVLLIACANLANLTLARGSVRQREMAVRLAIGAGRMRLIRQLLSESLLLAVCGSVLGILLAEMLCRYMLTFLNTEQDHVFLALTPDWRLIAFTAGLAILTCILFGLTPALRATKTQPAGAMKASGRGITAGRERFSLRRFLVVSQVALSLVLLAASLLFVRSLRNLTTLDAGLREDGLLIMAADIGRLHYTPDHRRTVYRNLLQQVRATPGIENVATANILPLAGNSWNDMIDIPDVPSKDHLLAWFDGISPNYFQTVETPLLAGRDFNDHDDASTPEVAIVNQEFCRKFLKGVNPLGQQIRMLVGPGERQLQYEIVGVAKDAKYQDLREDIKPVVFVAESQRPEPGQAVRLLIRSHLPLGALSARLKDAVEETEPEMSIEFTPFKTQVEQSLLRDRLMATLSSFFGLLAAALATVGLYGVISYMVAQRRAEIGIRMALGASGNEVMRLILKEATALLAAGLLLGAILAVSSSKAAGTLLFGLKATDPSTIALAILLLAFVAFIASFIPALRAARTEPMVALREE